jgi:hypothetical protein
MAKHKVLGEQPRPVNSIDDWAYNIAINIKNNPNIDASANTLINIHSKIRKEILKHYSSNPFVHNFLSRSLGNEKSGIDYRIAQLEPAYDDLFAVQRWKPSNNWEGRPVMESSEIGKYVTYKDYLALLSLYKSSTCEREALA